MKRNIFLAAVVMVGLALSGGRVYAQDTLEADPSDVLGEVRASAREWAAHSYGVTAMAFDGAGQRLATSGGEGAIKVWSLSGSPQAQAASRERRIFDLLWSPDGKYLLSLEAPARPTDAIGSSNSRLDIIQGHGPENNSIAVWDARSGALVSEWDTPRQSLLTARFARDGTLVVSGMTAPPDLRAHAAAPTPFVQWRSFPEGKVQREEPIRGQALSADGTAFAGWDINADYTQRTLEVWTPKGSKLERGSIALGSFALEDLAFSPDGKYLLATDSWHIKTWQVEGVRFVRQVGGQSGGFPGGQGITPHMALGGRWALRAGIQGALWDVETGTYQGTLGQGEVAAISADGRHGALATLARGGPDAPRGGMVRLYDLSRVQSPDHFPAWRQTTGGRLSDGLPLAGASMVGLSQAPGGDLAAVAARAGRIYFGVEGQVLRWSLSRSSLLDAFDLRSSPTSPPERLFPRPDDEPNRHWSDRMLLALSGDGSLVAARARGREQSPLARRDPRRRPARLARRPAARRGPPDAAWPRLHARQPLLRGLAPERRWGWVAVDALGRPERRAPRAAER